jgi:hypothetical protein
MAAVWMTVGNTGPAGATFACKVDGGGPVRVAVADNADMAGPVFTGSQAVDAQGVAKVSIAGLAPGTPWFWRVEDNGTIDTAETGRFRTLPTAGLPASFTIAAYGDAGLSPVTPGSGTSLGDNLVSDHVAFDTIRQAALAGGWPLAVNLGDWGYPDWGVTLTDTLANRRTFWDDNLLQPRQAALLRDVSGVLLWDDHDFAANNSDGTYANKANGLTVYGERMPHYPLAGTDGINQAAQIGRGLLIGADVRYNRSPNSDPDTASKTMLGATQKAWMEGLLTAASSTGVRYVIWLMPQQWLGTATDSWASFTTEQAELVQLFGDHGFAGRVWLLSADYHGVALDDGTNSAGGFPVLQCAAIDATPGLGGGGSYSHGSFDGRDQYGTLTVTDLGSSVSVRLTGWRGTTELVSHQSGFVLSTTVAVASGALRRTLAGSHRPLLEARVVTGHPTGDDPDGEEIPIRGGDVVYDGTAEVRATLRLDTLGISDATGRSTYPRFATDLLSPVRGAEIFIRYGLDLGGAGVLWTPLGYYRIEDDDQGEAPYGGIALAGKDRMAALIEGNLLSRRLYPASRAVGIIVEDLVTDIYPDAVIVWDDSSDLNPLGRVLVVEESRYEALRDIAVSTGKLMYWDDTGVLRFETPPDEDSPVWEVRSGRDGVLVSAARRVSRQDVVNGWVVVGQAADDLSRVRSVAIDNNPQSPTYFFGDFGQVVRRHESPLIFNQPQADTAAIALLRRSLGAPHEVEFSAITNPTLRPWQPTRATYRDGNRDVVVMQRVRVPLARQTMTGAGRTRILAAIGSV